MVRRKCLCSLDQKIKNQQSPRRRTDDSNEVRVEGRSTKGFISFNKFNLRELVLLGVGSLKTRELVLPRVGALNKRELMLLGVGFLKTRELVLPRVGSLKKGICVS